MTIDAMKIRKRELGYTNADIARLSCVPLATVNKIFGGVTKAPRRETLLALESVLAGGGNIPSADRIRFGDPGEGVIAVSDPPAQYGAAKNLREKKPGEYTLEDYLALPDEERVELIDGVFYDMAAPHAVHQFIALQIAYQMINYIKTQKGPCKPVLSPIDVQLDKDDKTVVQPDVLVLCRPEVLIKNGRVFGAPDLVIEILSPSTRKKDMSLKFWKYHNAGVREYWMIDPEKLDLVVYDLEHDSFPEIYSFKDKVPVHIWNGEFSVDFQAVYEDIKAFLD